MAESTRGILRLLCRYGLVAMGFALSPPAHGMELHVTRSAPTDLAITGLLRDVPPGSTRYVRWGDLAKLRTSNLKLTGEFVPGEQEVTVVFLTDLWSALPWIEGADTLLATCTDGYASVYRFAFIEEYRPFLILAINGHGPEEWPPPGLAFNPGPYVVSVSAAVVPSVGQLLDAGHKRPWGVTQIEISRYENRFSAFVTGLWSPQSPTATLGREIWVNSCASCHQGPAGAFGGTKSDRPFDVLVAHAAKNPGYFRHYVRDPKALSTSAKMEAHPHYTDVQLDGLIAFVTGGARP